MGNSLEDWKRTPTTASTLFGVHLPLRPPKTRRRVRLALALVVFYLLLTLVVTGLCKFVPQQLPQAYRRLLYYFFGSEDSDVAAMSSSVRHLVAGWAKLGNVSASEL
ncbi:hypothetical protein BN946_scf184937.g5 [Trametes cinnabarina]|uniref:Uncharacterized protein n=1 Tax=Pycnoporus cinnabarinus TaxID=5643 RepID=A0A060SQG2_PYCCI|nr:hypothetical protein BN946_scf184937.g5 [Trametes cinnabarina]